MPPTEITSSLLRRLRAVWDTEQRVVHPRKVFGIAKHLAVAVDLLVGKAVQIFAAAVADKGGAEDEIHHHAVVVLHTAVRAHSVDLAFLIADDADLLLKGIKRLDQTAHRFLHPGKGRIDLGCAGELARLQQYHLDFLLIFHCKFSFRCFS